MNFSSFNYKDWTFISWEKTFCNLLRLQLRLYKCFYVNDFKKALFLQKLIFFSKSVRFLSIRDITQLDPYKRLAGSDGKLFLNFTDRFLLSENLKIKLINWFPNLLRRVRVVNRDGSDLFVNLPTISDRCWQCMIKYSLEPAHEAFFSPRNLGYRSFITVHHLQSIFFYNLQSASFGEQKRILCLDLKDSFVKFDYSYLLKKIFIPRSIKVGVFRLLNLGFIPVFSNYFLRSLDFGSLLANITLDGIEQIISSVRFGYNIVFFLKPADSELFLFTKIRDFLSLHGLFFDDLNCSFSSSLVGFDFMGWNFKVLLNNTYNCLCTPSLENFNDFLKKVKFILNNSNFGSVCYF